MINNNQFKLKSDRLLLIPLLPEDVNNLHKLWTLPEVRKYLWDDEIIPESQTQTILEENLKLFNSEKIGIWGIYPLDNHKLIGFCGFWYFHQPPELQIIYGLNPNYWQQGFAIEAGKTILKYGFENKNFSFIIGSTDETNLASITMMKRIGMKFQEKKLIHGLPTLYFSISKEDWEKII